MARKTKTVDQNDTTKTITAVLDTETVKSVFANRPKDIKASDKAIDELAALKDAGKAQRELLMQAYFYGHARKALGEAYKAKTWEERFDAFALKHYGKAQPAASTLKAYKSNSAAYFEAAFAPFNADSIVKDVTTIVNVQLPWRAARVRNLIYSDVGKKVFKEKAAAPKADAIAEEIALTKTERTANPEVMIASLIRDAVTLRGNAEVTKYLKANSQYDWLAPILKTMVAERKRDTAAMKYDVARKAVAAAEAVIASTSDKPRGKAPAGVTKH